MRKCKYCGNEVKWNCSENGWYAAELDGTYHSCNGNKLIDPEIISYITNSVTVTDKYLADKFIKRICLYRYLHPRAKISYKVFTEGDLYKRQYLIRCSDKAFKSEMINGKV